MRISDWSSDVCSSDLDDGTLGNLTVRDVGKSLFLAIKNTCGTTELQSMHTRNLDDCAIRSKASLQTDDAAGRRERVFDVVDDFLVRIPGNLVDIFTERLARNRHTIAMKETAVQQSLHQHV